MDNNLNLEYRVHKNLGGNWLWPKEDQGCWRHLNKLKYFDNPHKVASLTNERKLIIQAGGNCGIYPKQYSTLFDVVITFEPDFRNFYCLSHNVPEKNVFKFQAALGSNTEFVNVTAPEKDAAGEYNIGGFQTEVGGIIPQVTIDSLNVQPNVIQLDIEGFEGFALLGAEKTIKKCRPVLVIENKDFGIRHNWGSKEITELLSSWGYIFSTTIGLDSVFIFSKNL